MTPNEYLNEILAKQDELAARCQQNPQGLGEKIPQLAALQSRLRALAATPDWTAQTTAVFQDFVALMEDVEQSYGVLPSALGGILHAPARDSDPKQCMTALEIIRNVFQRADDLLNCRAKSASATATEPPPARAAGSS